MNLVHTGDDEGAVKLSLKEAQSEKNNFQLWNVLYNLASKNKDSELAKKGLYEMIQIEPQHLALRNEQIKLFIMLGEKNHAHDCAKEATRIQSTDANAINQLAHYLYQLNAFNEALLTYKKAFTIDNGNATTAFNIATICRFVGFKDEAKLYCQRSIELNEEQYDAYYLRSDLEKAQPGNNHIAELKKVLDTKQVPTLARAQLLNAMAKEYEDLQDYPTSFKYRKKAAKEYRSQFEYDVNEDVAFMNKIREVYCDVGGQSTSNAGSEQIFIVGLPRAGSTLLERIISSHTKVVSHGERVDFSRHLTSMIENKAQNTMSSQDDLVEISSKINFTELGARYLKSVREDVKDSTYIIDKFPPNALYVGLIKRALPESKVILIERNPLDACYAMYKQLFTEIYQFSYDLDELSNYYLAHEKLMMHWKQLYKNQLHVVKYEDLVQNFELTVREAITFCDLEFEQNCLDFHLNTAASTTASASQIRKQLYSSSIGMWKNYQDELKPLITKISNR